MKGIRTYGSWPSPIDSGSLVVGARAISAPRIVRDRLYWLERRPSEGGRQVVMCGALAASTQGALAASAQGALAASADAGHAPTRGALFEVSPPGVNVRTRVHEYGGGEYTVWRDWIFFVDDADRRIHAGRIGGAVRPLSHAGSAFADLAIAPDGRWLVAVEERPRADHEPENRLIALELGLDEASGLASAGAPRVVAAGHDFYASPRFDPQQERLVFLAWDHPRMPWQGTWLEQVGWGRDGPTSAPLCRAGAANESLFQPGFAQDGALYVVSDRSGHWNLMRVEDAGLRPVHRLAGELGRPQWVFGLSTWAALDASRVLASVTRDGRDALGEIALASGAWREWPSEFVTIGGVVAEGPWLACVAGSPRQGLALYAGRIEGGQLVPVRDDGLPAALTDAPSVAEAIEVALPDGRKTHAFVYSPRSASWEGPPDERPPLLVKSHGGPTGAASAAFDPRIQFWTSRGFAVADVNYTGSSGYGRAYRDGLERAWGVLDVADCVAVAQALAAEGRVDADRLAITGGSAGGFTTLCALTFHDVFHAGASHYGIGDLEALVRDTHKFESHYTDWLVGVWPEEQARYVERSPIHHVDRLRRPVIFFQGLEDRVVPPNQAEAMVAALARRGVPHAYVPFEGEGHGFRRAENIRTALDGELHFYARIFGFEALRPVAVLVASLLLCLLGCVPLRGGWDSEAVVRATPAIASIEGQRLGDMVPFPALVFDDAGAADPRVELVACRFASGTRVRVAGSGPGWAEDLGERALASLVNSAAEFGLALAPAPSGEGGGMDGGEAPVGGAEIEVVAYDGEGADTPSGLGDTLVECDVARPAPGASARGVLTRAQIRMRRSARDEALRMQRADDAAWTGALLHEFGHALGFAGHVAAGDSLLVRDQSVLRALGRAALRGRPIETPTLAALYRLEPGRSLGERALSPAGLEWLEALLALDRRWRAEGLERQALVASVGDREARIAFRYADGSALVLRFPGYAKAIRKRGALLAVPDRATFETLRALSR